MNPRDEYVRGDRAGGASSSQSPNQGEEFDDSSRRSDANKSPSMGLSPDQLAADQSALAEEKQHVGVPVDEMLKGLIISQMRAPYVHVEGGIVNLIKECVVGKYPFFTHAALSGYVDHFQSVDDEDLGWGCGWRNIQILCSFLLAEDPEAREALFNGAGFVPDIPALQMWLEIAWTNGFDEAGAKYFNWSISGTRHWIGTTECASLLRSFGVRAKIVSFTALGGKRSRIDTETDGVSSIDLSNDAGNESAVVLNEGLKNSLGEIESASSRGGALSCDECGKVCHQGTRYRGLVGKQYNLCDTCMERGLERGGVRETRDSVGMNPDGNDDSGVKLNPPTPDDNSQRHIILPNCDLEHDWNLQCDGCGEPLRGNRYKSLTKRNCDLCSNCVKAVEESPTEGRSNDAFVIIEEFQALRLGGPAVDEKQQGKEFSPILQEDPENDQEQKSDDKMEVQRGVDTKEAKDEMFDDEQTVRARGGKNVHETDIGIRQYCKTPNPDVVSGAEHKSPDIPVGHEPIANNEREKVGMRGTSPGMENNAINHHHLIEWVWSYFTEDSPRMISANSHNPRDFVTMSKRSPLYFQHRGHSRTIVGIERRGTPDGMSEKVYLLVLDPSLSTDLLVKSLREKSRWQKLIKNDLYSLKETEYQLCYVDPGIATGEELEQLKVLSSFRYSYY